MKNMAVLSSVLQAAGASEVQFDCPWCGTKLALPVADFRAEATVLCPRCNNPIDLELQRRAAGQSRPAPPMYMQQPQRQQITRPRGDQRAQPPSAPPPPPPPPLDKKSKIVPHDAVLSFDPNKPLNPDDYFDQAKVHVDSIETISTSKDSWIMNATGRSTSQGPQTDTRAEKTSVVVCPSCAYENTPVPQGFEFGSIRKCTWCGKPLPK